MNKISIAIVDDHKLIREMWGKIFSGNLKFQITGESGSLDEAVEMIKQTRPDIVLLDINLGPDSGMDAIPLIRKFSPGTKIIVVSMHDQPSFAKKMLQLGAKAYITKSSSCEEVFTAINVVMKGAVYICTEIKNSLSDQVMKEEFINPGAKDLSMREIEIIKLIREGLSSKEISTLINIRPRTVEVHRHNILKKLKFKNTATLVNFINNTDHNFN